MKHLETRRNIEKAKAALRAAFAFSVPSSGKFMNQLELIFNRLR